MFKYIVDEAMLLLISLLTIFISFAILNCSAELTSTNNIHTARNGSIDVSIPLKSIPLRLVYLMFPEHRANSNGAGTYPIRDILVDFVNRNTTVLPYYNVTLDTYDTRYNVEHNVAQSIRLFTQHIASDCMIQSNATTAPANSCSAESVPSTVIQNNNGLRPVPLFFGPEYSGEAIVISQLATLYNVVHICGGTGAADLSDRSKYPNFFRTLMSGNAFVGLPRALLAYFNYTSVGLLPRDLAYTEPMQKIDFDLTSHNFNVLFRLKFQVPTNNNDSIDSALDSIQLYDARILIVWSIESDEDRLFCRTIDRWAASAASNDSQLPFSEKYLVIFIGMIEGASWLEPNATGLLPKCQHKELSKMLNGSLVAKYPLWSMPSDKLEFGLTNEQLIEKAELLGRTRYGHPTGELAPLVPRTVDAIWLGFLGLDALDRRLRAESPKPRSLLDFTFQSKDIAQMLVEEIKKIRFMGTGGLFKFDSNADVSGQIFVEQYRPGLQQSSMAADSEYVRVLKFDTEKLTVEPVAGEKLIFGTKTGLPPPDKKPPGLADHNSISLVVILAVAIAAALCFTACVSVVVYVVYRRKLAQNLARPNWLIDFSLLVMQDEKRHSNGSSLFGMAMPGDDQQRQSYATINTDGATSITGQKIAQFNNQAVTLQIIPSEAPRLAIGVRNYKLLASMRDDLHHDNIVNFLGYCAEPVALTTNTRMTPTTAKQYFVWERCNKGSLEQLIENGSLFNLDSLLESAIVLDVARGMAYLHSQRAILDNGGAHGAFCAAACLIDKRFSVKVANYGDQQLARELFGLKTLLTEVGEKDRVYYLAPEILRQVSYKFSNTNKTLSYPAVDVYAYGITMFALLSHAPPYDSSPKNMEHIIALIKAHPKSGQEPFRPSTDTLPLTNNKLLGALIERCWAETPTDRPAFTNIVKQLQQISGLKAGASVTDQLLQRLERYASDMESLVRERTNELEGEKRRSDTLLNAMLPPEIVLELKSNGFVQPESYDSVTIYFSDIAGFTNLSAASTPIQVVTFLNALYTMFDARIDQFDAYKIETIGDAYMVVSGLPHRNGTQHAVEIAKLSLALLCDIKSFVIPHRPDEKLQLRIGLHTGPCVAGVVGTKMPRYCLFGDTVNTASRMESNGLPSRVHISDTLSSLLATFGEKFQTKERGPLAVKGKGTMITYWLEGIRTDNH